ncbi:MAG: prepilin-type N-terminal cleavage/methylation domain-containing protein [Lentisphaeria bacterium]|nr:prepilin-type N-terminal cleavage/methylation domain-containing protein [Lentisphaeria bacterium]
MKRKNFTLTEMLVVVVVILILAAISSVAVIAARRKAELANCAANQGQMGKIITAAIQNNDGKLVSGNGSADKDLWITALYKKRLVQSLEESRCPGLMYTGNDDISDDDAREQAYGVVVAASGVFNFKSNKLLRDGKNSISPANMLLGGCCAKEFKNPAAVATLDNSNGKLIAIHSGDVLNSFFLDGSVTSLEADAFKGKSFYVPKSDGSSAEKFSGGILQDK